MLVAEFSYCMTSHQVESMIDALNFVRRRVEDDSCFDEALSEILASLHALLWDGRGKAAPSTRLNLYQPESKTLTVAH